MTELGQRRASWVVTIAMTILAGALRLVDLGHVPTLLFDETYYVKDAWSLRTLGYEGVWAPGSDAAFATGDTSGLSPAGAFVAHPPLGKWLISLGFSTGHIDPVSWRLTSALAGAVGVALLCRLLWLLFHSVLASLLGGLFLATDGIHVVLSRIAILDIFLSTLILASFVAIAKDNHQRGRPWLWVGGIALGAACAVKWSGLYAAVILGLIVVGREIWLRQRAGESWVGATLYAGVALSIGATLTYLAAWLPWFLHPSAWGNPNLWQYHADVLSFHTGLDAEHPYRSHPWTWLFQLRPTAFWYEAEGNQASFITALGNPALWWFGFIALVALLGAFFLIRTWRTGLLLSGYLATYLPWFLFPHRTMFTFYTVTIVPFVAAVAAVVLAWLCGTIATPLNLLLDQAGLRTRFTLTAVSIIIAALIVGCAVYFSPIWMGTTVPEEVWRTRMWLPSWI